MFYFLLEKQGTGGYLVVGVKESVVLVGDVVYSLLVLEQVLVGQANSFVRLADYFLASLSSQIQNFPVSLEQKLFASFQFLL